ncbi:MAG: tryptophan--tRNA ligase [Candidatus Omnitrophica bacterium]|nr:tryptophan--tRNA ligase [Candidatus Omnitrophota bacterium]
MAKQIVLSGMRPTGKLHLGHLFGALENWKALQEEYECFFMVADWHALMSEYKHTQALRENSIDNVLDWIACGIAPERSAVFVQSDVPEHLELYMLFSVITPLGLLERCPTYKEQLREIKGRDLHTYGFLGYPVLQAADIMLYRGEKVPVGEDQLPHLELTRQIVRKFNHLYGKDFFPEPQALLTRTKRLLGLDGRKMSKSYGNFIALCDEPALIRRKVQGMFTDPARIKASDPGHPDTCNVHSYYGLIAPARQKEINQLCRRAEIGCTDCKKDLAERLIAFLEPLREKRARLSKNKNTVNDILAEGKKRARAIAASTVRDVRKIVGYGI